jgi:hypothetical protein
MLFNLAHSQVIFRYKKMAVESNHTIVIMLVTLVTLARDSCDFFLNDIFRENDTLFVGVFCASASEAVEAAACPPARRTLAGKSTFETLEMLACLNIL